MAVLVGLTAFGLWASQYTARITQRALDASHLSNDYSDAATAVAAEESLERKYRLEPGPTVLASYRQAAADLASALGRVHEDGGADDVLLVEHLLAQHAQYLDAIARMFAAVDEGDAVKVLSIDGTQVDPLFGAIERIVDANAREHHATSVRTLDDLRRIERFFAFSHARRVPPRTHPGGGVLVHPSSDPAMRWRTNMNGSCTIPCTTALTELPNRVRLADLLERALIAGRRAGSETGFPPHRPRPLQGGQ